MIGVASLPAFFGLVIVVALAVWVANRRTSVGSALLAAIGAAVVLLYLIVAISTSLLQ